MDASKGGASDSFLKEESACYINTNPFIVCLRFQGNALNHLFLNHCMMEGMSAVVFLTVPDSFSCRSVVSFVVCYDSGFVTSCMENSTNACPLLSEMSKKCKH